MTFSHLPMGDHVVTFTGDTGLDSLVAILAPLPHEPTDVVDIDTFGDGAEYGVVFNAPTDVEEFVDAMRAALRFDPDTVVVLHATDDHTELLADVAVLGHRVAVHSSASLLDQIAGQVTDQVTFTEYERG